MFGLAQALFGASLTVATAWAAGRVVYPQTALPAAVRFVAGSALLSLAAHLLLLLGAASAATFAGLSLAVIAVSWRVAGRPRLTWPRPNWWWLAAAPYAALYLVHALAPEIQPDGYTYHLGLVEEWLQEGGFTRRVGFYESLPQGLEMLFAYAYAFGQGPAAKLVHLAFLAASGPLIAAAALRLGVPGWPAAALFALAPVTGITGTSAYNDVALASTGLACFHALLAWRQERDRGWLALGGLFAGFCYAIKLTGVIVAPAIAVYFAARRRWRELLVFAAPAALMTAPYLVRNTAVAHNPVAPLFNRYFPNAHFHVSVEEQLTRQLRSYRVAAWDVPWEAAIWGQALHGLTGPVFLLAPLALPVLRRTSGRAVWLAAGVAMVPWFFNLGTRFLLPALPFLALAMELAFPPRLLPAVALAHAVLGWPAVMDLYTKPQAWRLRGFPWEAALRLEREQDYLRRTLREYGIAEMLNRRVKPGELVLDLVGAPLAYTHAAALSPWQHASAGRAADAMEIASRPDRGVFYTLHAAWPTQPLRGIRIVQTAAGEENWSLQEIRVFDGGETLFPRRAWRLRARPNLWESHFALDRNTVTRWSAWQDREPGMYFEIEFPDPQTLTGVELLCLQSEDGARVRVEGLGRGGAWQVLSGEPERNVAAQLSYRANATRAVKREGFRYILTRDDNEGYGRLGRDLVHNPGDWGLDQLENEDKVYLFRLR